MKKSTWIWLTATGALMLLCPWISSLFKGMAGFAIVVLLLYVVDPVFCFATGIFAGRAWRQRWWLILTAPVLYLAGAWLFVAPFESTFLIYAVGCLSIGLLAMTGTAAFLVKRLEREKRGK